MNRINDGGPVFPQPLIETRDGAAVGPDQPGMSLRDYFAGQALKAAADSICDQLDAGGWSKGAEANADAFALTALQNAKEHAARHAMSAYLLADAMIAERERSK